MKAALWLLAIAIAGALGYVAGKWWLVGYLALGAVAALVVALLASADAEGRGGSVANTCHFVFCACAAAAIFTAMVW